MASMLLQKIVVLHTDINDERSVSIKQPFIQASIDSEDHHCFQFYPWELLDNMQTTYRTTGISLNQPPTIDISETVTLSEHGHPVYWANANAAGLPALREMIRNRQTNELSSIIKEVGSHCNYYFG